jgi:hypothetical protein
MKRPPCRPLAVDAVAFLVPAAAFGQALPVKTVEFDSPSVGRKMKYNLVLPEKYDGTTDRVPGKKCPPLDGVDPASAGLPEHLAQGRPPRGRELGPGEKSGAVPHPRRPNPGGKPKSLRSQPGPPLRTNTPRDEIGRCPCGYMGDPKRACKCNSMQVEKYVGRVSGPLLDRIDLHIEVPAVPFQELSATADGTASAAMRASVDEARAVQRRRFGDGPRLNSRMTSRQMRKFCMLDAEGKGLLQTAMDDLGLSARAHDRILRVSRTIADLEGAETIRENHVSEAIGYRSLDRRLWAK